MLAPDPDLPLLGEEATQDDLRNHVNTLTSKFVSKSLADHLDTALSLESDDWTANCYMQRKVSFMFCDCVVILMVFLFSF